MKNTIVSGSKDVIIKFISPLDFVMFLVSVAGGTGSLLIPWMVFMEDV